NDSALRSTCVNVRGKSIIRPSIRLILLREDCVGDLETQLGGAEAEALEPEGALVEAVQRVLPGEADARVHLDRALARGDRGLGGERLGGGGGERRAPTAAEGGGVFGPGAGGFAAGASSLVLLRDAPGGPVDERARELD